MGLMLKESSMFYFIKHVMLPVLLLFGIFAATTAFLAMVDPSELVRK